MNEHHATAIASVMPKPETREVTPGRYDHRFVVAEAVRCPTPGCDKKLAESLTGTLVITCRNCKVTHTFRQ